MVRALSSLTQFTLRQTLLSSAIGLLVLDLLLVQLLTICSLLNFLASNLLAT